MSASLKLRQLESKLSSLKEQQQHLLNQREKEIAALLTSLDLTSLEDSVLLGGLLFLKDKIILQDPIMEVWRNTGSRFLRRKQKSSPRIPSGKAIPSKGNTTSNPTPQGATKLPQSRKEQDEKTTEITA